MMYRFIYNNGSSDLHRKFDCDADAMMNARVQLSQLKKINNYITTVHIWEEKGNGKFRYINSYE